MIQKQFFRVFQLFAPEVKHFYLKNTSLFCENDLKHEMTLVENLIRKESKLRMSLEQFVSFITTKSAFNCY